MSTANAKEKCTYNCWMIGGGVGLLGLLLMWLAGGYGFVWSLFWGIILGVAVGWLLSYLLCGKADGADTREDSGAGSFGAAGAGAAAATAAAATTAAMGNEEREDSGSASYGTQPDVADAAGDAADATQEDSGAGSFGSDKPAPGAAAATDPVQPAGPAAREDSGAASYDATSGAADAAGDAATAAHEDSGAGSFGSGKSASDAATPAKDPEPVVEAAREDSGAASLSGEDYDGDGVIEGENEGTRPEALSGPRDGGADDLKEIKGVGPKMEGMLHDLGFYHFDQIAAWTGDEVAWVDANLKGFRGRVSRDNWVEQARVLAAGGETEFSKKVQKGNVY